MAERLRKLAILADSSTEPHIFAVPSKKINDAEDVTFWLQSKAYTDIMTFLLQLDAAMFPRKDADGSIETFEMGSTAVTFSSTVVGLQKLLSRLADLVQEAPPDPGPRRFGNISFRKWYSMVESEIDQLLGDCLPKGVLDFDSPSAESVRPVDELRVYLLGSFGSAQRLDYGTGHELSFLAFIAGIWKLGGFEPSDTDDQERGIVLGAIAP
jgi:serine/threonine-protein phosphatase 2A activator